MTAEKISWIKRLQNGLKRSSSTLADRLVNVIVGRKIDEDLLQDLEDTLIEADFGLEMAEQVVEKIRKEKSDTELSSEDLRRILVDEITDILGPVAQPLEINETNEPHVILVVGVNGTGKTTTIGKIAYKFSLMGKKILLAAGDTFRAAAIEQLQIWSERAQTGFIAKPEGSDAASLAFEAVEQARREKLDMVLIDTAGRLHNNENLMAELEKIIRVIKKQMPDAPHSVLLVLDATSGQNVRSQVETFSKMVTVSGLVMTKLDGTARGGILVSVAKSYGLPVHFIGVGEQIEDLEPFEAQAFAQAIIGQDGVETDSVEESLPNNLEDNDDLQLLGEALTSKEMARVFDVEDEKLQMTEPEIKPSQAPQGEMNSFLRFMLEFGPLGVFYLGYTQGDKIAMQFPQLQALGGSIFLATAAFMVAISLSLAITWIIARRVAIMPLVTAVVVLVFGTLTITLQNDMFIKMKPTLVNLLFGGILLGGLLLRQSLLKHIFSPAFNLDDEGWRILTWRWGFFFLFLAGLNEIIWRNFSESFWVDFKVFGILPITMLFTLVQLPLIKRHGGWPDSKD